MNLGSIVSVLLVAGALSAPGARAAEPGPFIAAVSAAWPQFKMAWFYSRNGNAMLAGDELDGFTAAWRRIEARFADHPPGPFARDKAWKASLSAVSGALGRAARLLAAEDTKGARDTLAKVRGELGALRRRNGVILFSDHVDAYGAIVDRLVALRTRTRAQATLSDGDIAAYRGLAAELRAAVENLQRRASAALRANPGFAGSIEGNFASIAKLERGIRSRFPKAIYGSVASVRADYILLFTRYG